MNEGSSGFRLPALNRANPQVLVGLGLVVSWAACLLTFWPATHGPFVFDDFPNLQNLHELGGVFDWAHLGRYVWAFSGNPGRPLSALSFLIEDWAWPSAPAAFKRDNLLFHLLTGVAFFALGRRLARLRLQWAKHADVIALAAASMWLLHPMQLSATMLVVQRMNILSTLCMVLGLLGYLRLLAPSTDEPIGPRRALMALVLLGLAMMIAVLFKENGALLPVYALVLNLTLLKPSLARMQPRSRRLLLAGTSFPLLLMIAGLTLSRDSVLHAYAIRNFNLGERLLTEPRVLFDYLHAILLPQIGGQGLFHDGYVVSRGLWSPPSTAFAIAGLLAILIAAWSTRNRLPAFTFAVAWFIGGHLMESTVIPLELYFEHRNYMPMFGPLFVLAASALTVSERYLLLVRGLLCTWLLAVITLTAYNATIWGDRGKLSLVWLSEQPTSIRAAQMAASYYNDNGNIAAARDVLSAAIVRMPNAVDLRFQQVLLDCYSHGVTPLQWQDLEQLARKPIYLQGVAEVAGAFVKSTLGDRCHYTITPRAVENMVLGMTTNPAVAAQSEAMGYLYYELAKIPERERDLNRLMYYLDKSYQYRPNPLVPREQAIHLLTAGLPKDAMRYLDLSDNTPQPWFKAVLLNITALNAPLRRSALQMQRTMHH